MTLGLLEKFKTIQLSNMCTLFHLDATFKLSEIGYPVITCGLSDCSRPSVPRRQVPDVLFHVLYNVKKRTRQLDDFAGAMVYKGIVAMHYAANVLEYYEIRDTILAQWRKVPLLRSFADYFEKQWINSRFWRWQAFHTPTGFATTNNPCETFNASVKRHVMRKVFDTKWLLRKITKVCEDVTADNVKPTKSCGDPPSTVVTTARKLVHARQLVSFETSNPQVIRILQLRAFNGESRRLSEAAYHAFARLITNKTADQLHEHLGRRQNHKASAMHNHAMKWSLNMSSLR